MVAVSHIWSTQSVRLWLWPKGEDLPELLSWADASSLNIVLDDGSGVWKCRYCQNIVKQVTKCPHCNAPMSSRSHGGTMIVEGYLPDAFRLDELVDGFAFEILAGDCGDPSDYDAHIVAIRIENCEIVEKWIPTLGGLDFDATALTLCLKVKGQVTFLPKREK